MAVEFKDYYQTLGVTRSASDDEVRKAFRKLARQYHPDVAKNKAQGETKFKEINEAYEVLGDPEKRKKYDSLGANWKNAGYSQQGGPQFRTRGGPAPSGEEGSEFHFGGTGFSDFFEQFFGSTGSRRGGFNSSGRPTPDFGQETDASEKGRDAEADLMVTLEEAMRGSVRQVSLRREAPCPKCGGTGYLKQKPCPECQGSGQVARAETHQVKVPAGIREGQKLRLAGKGEQGVGGAQPGDLFLRVRVASHPDFRVENDVLCHDLDLAPWEAVLGTNVLVPTLESPVNIKIPAGTQSGQKMRIRGRGLPGRSGDRGDLVVAVRVRVPKSLPENELKLWETLARESKFNPRD